MKTLKLIVAITIIGLLITSCAMVKTPLSGYLYSNVKSPVAVTGNSGSSKVGTAQANSILGWVATGDASIEAAVKSAGITKIHHVDEEGTNILGFYATYKIYVYGE